MPFKLNLKKKLMEKLLKKIAQLEKMKVTKNY